MSKIKLDNCELEKNDNIFFCDVCNNYTYDITKIIKQQSSISNIKCNNKNCERKPDWYICCLCINTQPTKKRKIRHFRNVNLHAKTHIITQQNDNIDSCKASETSSNDSDDFDYQNDNVTNSSDSSVIQTETILEHKTSNDNNKESYWIHKTIKEKKIDQNYYDVTKKNFHEHSASPAFFSYEIKHPNQGAHFLLGKAFSANPEDITDDEVQFALMVAKLLNTITLSQRELFADILLKSVNANNPQFSIFKNTRVPTTMQDFDKYYLNGPNSFLKNLPMPLPQKTSAGDTYVSLIDIIANMLAADKPLDEFSMDRCKLIFSTNDDQIPLTSSITQNSYDLCMELVKEESSEFVRLLWIHEWADDFDPSHTKSNRQQTWIKTYTICPPIEKMHSGENTFIMSLSNKNTVHDDVEKILLNEIQSLKDGKYFFYGGTNSLIKVKAAIKTTCMDRPAITKHFQVSDLKGTYSKFFGMTSNIDAYCEFNHLPNCSNCRKQNIEMLTSQYKDTCTINKNCKKCSQWNVNAHNFNFPAPQHYPQNYDKRSTAPKPPKLREPGLKKLINVNLNIEWLKEVLAFAYHQSSTDNPKSKRKGTKFWNKQTLKDYLRSCGVIHC